jgi:hypothetical protein
VLNPWNPQPRLDHIKTIASKGMRLPRRADSTSSLLPPFYIFHPFTYSTLSHPLPFHIFHSFACCTALCLQHTHRCQFLKMAALQPPPNWEAFSAASGRVVQALQDVPDDLAKISSELRQLEHQPTNAMLLQQFQQSQQQVQQQLAAL